MYVIYCREALLQQTKSLPNKNVLNICDKFSFCLLHFISSESVQVGTEDFKRGLQKYFLCAGFLYIFDESFQIIPGW